MRFVNTVFLFILLVVGCSDKPTDAPVPTPTKSASIIPITLPSASTSTDVAPPETSVAAPSTSAIAETPIAAIDAVRFDMAVRAAIDRGEIPGATLVVLRHGQVVYRRAYGFRAKEPVEAPMTSDTVFDLASLTKPLATATSILLLNEQGRLQLRDPVKKWLPAFVDAHVTIEHLLRHVSGLPAGNARAVHAPNAAIALEIITKTELERTPGEAYVYSDLGYVLLGEIVAAASGQKLDSFANTNIFLPLGLSSTSFLPTASVQQRIAPTTREGEDFLVGTVHDPLARKLGGISGNAGLFATADDIAKFVATLMNNGELSGKRIFSSTIVHQLLDLHTLPKATEQRSLGLISMFEGIGHTGFTGTAFWIDPARNYGVVLLTNGVHPDGKGKAKQARQDVATAAILMSKGKVGATAPPTALVQSGVDQLERQGFSPLDGRKIGIITNHTGKNDRGERTIDVLVKHDKLALRAIFTPEHGLTGTADGLVQNGKDSATGIPIFSLYGQNKRPPDDALKDIDTLVFDLQDAGVRFYTYISTLGIMMEEAAKRKLRFVVLDRPNPLGGRTLEGPILDADRESFVGYHEIPIRHGMTLGELARMFNTERKIGVELHVVEMVGWKRSMLWAQTGLSWLPPSPNLRTALEALLYPGIGLLETTNLSVGRGTSQPFEQVGAPYIDAQKLTNELHQAKLVGVRFTPITFTPTSSTFAKETCNGVRIEVTQIGDIESVRLGLTIAATLRRLYPTDWKATGMMTLLGNKRALDALVRGESADRIIAQYENDLADFANRRGPFLLYP